MTGPDPNGAYVPGDLVRVWRGVRPGRSQEAMVLGEVRTLGGTLVVPVRLTSGGTDHIALTHVERILIDTEATVHSGDPAAGGAG